MMDRRYQIYRGGEDEDLLQTKELGKNSLFFTSTHPRSFNGDTWDARHMSEFLRRSNYSNWRGNDSHISRTSDVNHTRSYSTTQGDHFFKTTKQDKNQSKIGFTPVFPLVSNSPILPAKDLSLRNFFNSSQLSKKDERIVSGRQIRLRCSPEDRFKFQGNAVKYKHTDPLTMRNEPQPFAFANGFQKERMSRLISSRHPHGITGIDHNQNPESQYYSVFEDKIRVREEPNSHRTHLIDRDWKEKKRSKPPVDQWKARKIINIRKFRNENVHGYNILTNRKLEQ